MPSHYSDRPYKTTMQLADYLGYQGTEDGKRNAVLAWMKKTGVPKKWRGKTWVVHPDDADRALAGERVRA